MAAWPRTEAGEISAREEPRVQQAVTNDDWGMFGGAEFIWLLVTWGLTLCGISCPQPRGGWFPHTLGSRSSSTKHSVWYGAGIQ